MLKFDEEIDKEIILKLFETLDWKEAVSKAFKVMWYEQEYLSQFIKIDWSNSILNKEK